MHTTKSAYQLLHQENGNETHNFSWIWKLKTSKKIQSFFWLLFHERLPTGSYLHHVGIQPNPICPICNSASESSPHIFFECTNAQGFWNEITSKSTKTENSPIPAFNPTEWHHTWAVLKKREYNNNISWAELIPFCFWQIWLTRNNNTFNNKKDRVDSKCAITKATEFAILMLRKEKQEKEILKVKWEPPKANSFKLNCDGSAVGNPGRGGLGGVFRDAGGNWVLGYVGAIQHTTNTQAELLALLKGLQLAEEKKLVPLEINTDSTEVITMLIKGNLYFDSIIFECRSIVQRLGDVVVKHTYRETNQVADLMAKEGAKRAFFEDIFVTIVPPVFVNNAFWADITGTMFERNIMVCNSNSRTMVDVGITYPNTNNILTGPNGQLVT